MQKTGRKKIWKWVKIAVIAYLAIGIALYYLQDKFLFHPEKLDPAHQFSFNTPFKEIEIAVNNEKSLSIVQFTVPDSIRKGVVLYFHGNRQNIERYAPFALHFTCNNYEVWMMDYPGFGKSTGDRSEQVLYDDAMQLYKMARSRFSKDSIILYGKSIGTGIACQLASIRECKRLILETPYASMDALMRGYAFIYPVSWMTNYHFPNDKYFELVGAPISIFHGTNDEVIPFRQSTRLMKPWKKKNDATKELIAIKNGKHNNLHEFPLFQQKLDSLLAL